MENTIINQNEICKELKNIRKDIVIVSPAYKTKKGKEPEIGDHLRVYLNGGIIGTIYDGIHPAGKSSLISKNYSNHYKNKTEKLMQLSFMELKDMANEKGIKELSKLNTKEEFISILQQEEFKGMVSTVELTNKQVIEKLTSPEYIQLCYDVLQRKWTKNKNLLDEDKEDLNERKERNIEAKILSQYINNKFSWNAIDMEVCFPKKYMEGHKFGDNTSEQPRFDIIAISKDGIGIIELKVNNESCSNLNGHYEHMCFVRKKPQKFLDGIKDKTEHLNVNRLISDEIYNQFIKYYNEKKLWFGFLFVGGEKKTTKNKVLKFRDKDLKDIKFLYCSFEDIDNKKLDINQMKSLDKFIDSLD